MIRVFRRTEKAKADPLRGSSELAIQFKTAITAFERNIPRIIALEDPYLIKKATEHQIRDMMARLNVSNLEAFTQIMEDGLARAGVNISQLMIDPNTVRIMYYNSPIWTAYKRMNDDLVSRTNDVITRSMLKEGGFNQRAIAKQLQFEVNVANKRARTIARTETAVVQNKGRELGFKIKNPEGDWRFKWGGPYDDGRNSDACKWIRDHIPRGGLPLEELKQLVHTATRKFYPKLTPRDWSAHPNCRHYPQKVVT